MGKTILLNWIPPAREFTFSPALSVLKFHLKEQGFDVRIKYWNLILYSFLFNYLSIGKSKNFDYLKKLPFYVYIAIKNNDAELLDRLAYQLLFEKPHLHSKGINYIKSYFLEKNAILCKLIDSELSMMDIDRLALIGFSSQFDQWIVADIIAKKIKKINQEIPVIIGGFGSKEKAYSFMSNFPDFDYASWGEGEHGLSLLTHYLCKTSDDVDLIDIPNTLYRSDNKLMYNDVKNKFIDLDNLKFDISDYIEQLRKVKVDQPILMPIEGSRGCHWQRCHFCFLNIHYKYRIRSIRNIIEEIREKIKEYKIYRFSFLDNDIVGKDLNRFDKLLDELIALKEDYPDLSIHMAEIITKGLSYELIKKMSLANFKTVQIGYESPSENLLKKIDKKNTFASNFFFIKWGAVYGVSTDGLNVLRNLPEETNEDIKQGINNFYFYRFLIGDKIFKHQFSFIAIAKCSKYFKSIEMNNELLQWQSDTFKNLPENFIKDKDKYILYDDWGKSGYNPLWDVCEKVESHYMKNKFEYSLIVYNSSVYYKEFYNAVLLKELEFDIKGLYWYILVQCNKRILSVNELLSKYGETLNKEDLCVLLQELRQEGLIYCNDEYSEIVTIINTDKIS